MPRFIETIRARAKILGRTIVFPESHDERVLAAVTALVANGIVRPVLILDPVLPATHPAARATGAATIEGDGSPVLELADRMVASGTFDGCVAGAAFTTAEVLRAAIKNIGVKPGMRTVSSAFYMVAGHDWEAANKVLTFTDCAVVPYPTAEQLADIAISAAEDRKLIVGDVPRVALLSFSTAGSAAGPSVDLVRQALGMIRDRNPHSRWTENCKVTPRWCQPSQTGSFRDASYPAMQTCSSFRHSTRETSLTSWFNVWLVRARSVRCCKVLQDQPPISRAGQGRRTLLTSPRSPRFSRQMRS
jgi:Phosphotransacetylase